MGLDPAGQTRAPTGTRHLHNYERVPLHVWEFPHAQLKQSHFAAFPPELVERCLPAGCPPSGHVLDPFGGSGTTGAAARAIGMGATLIELNPEYAALVAERCAGAGRDYYQRREREADGQQMLPF